MLDINIEKMNQILSDEDLAKLIFDYAMSPSDIDFARAIEQAVMQKPLEQKPVAWVHSSGFVTKDADWVFDRKEECEPLYLHPAPSAPKSPFTAGEDNDGWYVEFEGDQIAYGLTEEKANHIVSNYNAPSAPEGMVLVPIEIIDRFPQLNPSNYDHEGVCYLNAWGVELELAAARSE